ncbi:SpoIID/LytB domain-containing protein [Nocardioides sp. InS609-2]|uniref:SpoIID/LytB domain-containing protein n=1 Tax=Nocardioides sp. InS609-2 TaxID=2760705 RepID=UPI0017C870AA|nr:SpoIID/LytB domain-containing protein [Nocardioides sp. InS609-2]MBA3780658.1 SpoIID/LytB domain-containing protein [Nocardioides sp.]
MSPVRPPTRKLLMAATAALTLQLGFLLHSPSVAQSIAVNEIFAVPPTASITVSGHGYGHGHGMSQYGAEGAARTGLGYRDIIGFYYAGTEWGTASGPIKVLVSGDTTDDVVVLTRKGLSVRNTSTQEKWLLPANGATQWRLIANKANKTVVSHRAGTGGWQQLMAFAGDGEFFAKGAPIALVTPSRTVAYRGKLRAAAPSPGSVARDTVNILGLDRYVRGVVPLEIPASWSPEAVRAQAVAARTYASYERAHPRAGHYQVCDTTSCQVYGGRSAENPLSDEAVAATAGQALTVAGEPAFAQFASSSGGWTAAGSVPYLAAREDPYDGWAGNPVHAWTKELTDATFEAKWPKIGNLTQLVVDTRDGNGEWGGRVADLTIVGDQGTVTVSGDTVRSVLGLRSTWFTFTAVTAPVAARAE